MIKVKICGVNTPEVFYCCVKYSVDFIGIMQCESSPRYISLELANQLCTLPLSMEKQSKPKIVAVTVDANDQQLLDIITVLNPDFIQCHGQETPDRIFDIKQRFKLPVIKSLPIDNVSDLVNSKDYNLADYWLLDAKPTKKYVLSGGNAISFNWSLLSSFLRNNYLHRPWFLAGGINLNNVDLALQKSKAKMIDLSSGVEIKKGVKSIDKIKFLMNHIHRSYN